MTGRRLLIIIIKADSLLTLHIVQCLLGDWMNVQTDNFLALPLKLYKSSTDGNKISAFGYLRQPLNGEIMRTEIFHSP